MTPKPGRELDALIAEKVMGFSDGPHTLYRWHDRKKRERPLHGAFHRASGDPIGDFSAYVNEAGEKFFCGRPKQVHWPSLHSIDTRAAWEVVEKMEADGWGHKHIVHSPEAEHSGVSWTFMKPGQGEQSMTTIEVVGSIPYAICLAALKAVE